MKQFLLLLIIYLSISFAMQYLLPADELLLDSLSQTISVNKAEEVLAQLVKYRWVGYVLSPVLLLLKWLLVAGLLYTALFFANVKLALRHYGKLPCRQSGCLCCGFG
jgi:hypothetical protein